MQRRSRPQKPDTTPLQRSQNSDDKLRKPIATKKKNKKDVIWNIPNCMTMVRIAIVPFYVYLIFSPTYEGRRGAFILFILAGLTDFFDGIIARVFDQCTDFGAFLDPLADKALVLSTFISFIFIFDQVQTWMVVIIFVRDIMVTLLRRIAIRQGKILRTSKLAKAKTDFQMFTVLILLITFLYLSFGERQNVNALYKNSGGKYINSVQVAYQQWSEWWRLVPSLGYFTSKQLHLLASCVPYFLMVITTIVTLLSGVRYFVNNWNLIWSS